jgi:hypothetical protein
VGVRGARRCVDVSAGGVGLCVGVGGAECVGSVGVSAGRVRCVMCEVWGAGVRGVRGA